MQTLPRYALLLTLAATGLALYKAPRWLQQTRTQLLQQPAPSVQAATVTIQDIQALSDLTTSAYTMQVVVPTHQDATLAGVTLATTHLLYIAVGTVKAGVDLKQATLTNNVLTLPAPQILDKHLEVERSKVYAYDRGNLNLGPDVAPDLQQAAQAEALKQVVITACQQGVLDKANQQAELVLSKLLSKAETPISIKVQPPVGCGN